MPGSAASVSAGPSTAGVRGRSTSSALAVERSGCPQRSAAGSASEAPNVALASPHTISVVNRRGTAMRMQGCAVFLLLGLAACTASGSKAPDGSPPATRGSETYASVEAALSPRHGSEHVYRGDLDGDGDSDALVLTSPRSGERADPRGITVMVHAPDGWRVAARNDRAVLCSACGGAMGDPLVGIDAASSGFEMRFEGGSRELWSAAYRFGYEPAGARWVLVSVDRKVLDRATGVARKSHADAADLGAIDFTEFDPADETLAPLE